MHERLKFARLQAHVSQQQLASHLGITRNAISLWEKGETKPEIVRLGPVAEFLNCRLDWLLYGTGYEPEQTWRRDEMKEEARWRKKYPAVAAAIFPQPLNVEPTRSIPVYAAEKGDEEDSLFIDFDGPTIEMASPPAEILTVRQAFGVLITEDSMMPTFTPGDIAWIHPHVEADGGYGLLLSRGRKVGKFSGRQEALIRLIGRRYESDEGAPRGWVATRLHPEREIEAISIDDFNSCLRIVGVRFAR